MYISTGRISALAFLLATTSLWPAVAQVATDGTLGPKVSRTGSNIEVEAGLGQIRGQNLFHSFERFGVQTNGKVTFTGPGGLNNVISRVTGGQTSSIDGTLASTVPGADVYLINPSGVVFGPNARLDVPGSFHASTADELRFADGAVFSALDPAGSQLSVAAPQAFGFLGDKRSKITVDQSVLEVPEGKALSLVGGDVEIKGGPLGFIEAEAGRVTISAIDGAGSMQIADGKMIGAGADIRLSDRALVDVSGNGGGTVHISGDRLVAEDFSLINADNIGAKNASGGIVVEASVVAVTSGSQATTDARSTGSSGQVIIQADTLDFYEGGDASSRARAAGNAGGVTVETGQLTIARGDSEFATGVFSSAESSSTGGNAGPVTVTAERVMNILNGGAISSNTFGAGNAGDVKIDTGKIYIDSTGSGFLTGISSEAKRGSIGQAGKINIEADALHIREGSVVSSSTFSGGNAGELTVNTGQLLIDREASGLPTGIFASAEEGSTGNGGPVTVTATTSLDILKGGEIRSGSFAAGTGGQVTVNAGHLTIDGGGLNTGITSQAGRLSTGGRAGMVKVEADVLKLLNVGAISSSTFAAGDAGNVFVEAGQLIIDSGFASPAFTGITSQTNPNSTGSAGVVTVKAGQLQIRRGGLITSDTQGTKDAGLVSVEADVLEISDFGAISSGTFAEGDGGEVKVQAKRLIINGGGFGPPAFTGIGSEAGPDSSGEAGGVTVQAGELEIHNAGEISSSTLGSGAAGNVDIITDTLTIADASVRTRGETAVGGQIGITATGLIYLLNADVTSSGIEPAAGASLITLQAPVIALNNSRVESLTGSGQPLQGSGEARLLGDTTVISATSIVAASSSVETTGLQTDLGSELQLATGTFLDADQLLRESCAAQGSDRSTFIRTGKGGLPPSPDRPLASLHAAPAEGTAADGEAPLQVSSAAVLPCEGPAAEPKS
ncbi:MAG TPA: filamentous hemagglutinin N-terminal domain-containing protein [Geminicoccus sp.]|jgi:filamentous hemagglutinin family protein|uniref:two-partner secretion domain-containing protein n=1 Tax=Geminicoccus sp. TaxID=2024832 RepID=UPI002E310663|nr:filamentous hemagglutinin N-terminal domain-containing protein [Geminicoccus sp.]HEX2525045.1 filamentous hemagglutinin N-terminal domain-containing protein [Geminicoccus sp.]